MKEEVWQKETVSQIDERIYQIVSDWNKEADKTALSVRSGDSDSFKTFTELMTRGSKRTRGVLAKLSYHAFGGTNEAAGLDAAVAVEAIQTGLLIIDDTQDNADGVRGDIGR